MSAPAWEDGSRGGGGSRCRPSSRAQGPAPACEWGSGKGARPGHRCSVALGGHRVTSRHLGGNREEKPQQSPLCRFPVLPSTSQGGGGGDALGDPVLKARSLPGLSSSCPWERRGVETGHQPSAARLAPERAPPTERARLHPRNDWPDAPPAPEATTPPSVPVIATRVFLFEKKRKS